MTKLSEQTQAFGAWSGLVYLCLMVVGFWLIAGLFPPLSPTASADDIAGVYEQEHMRIRFGMLLIMLASAFYVPFTAVLAKLVMRVENRVGILTISQVMGGAGNVLLTFYPAVWWLSISYRPERRSDLTMMLNDAIWLQLVGGLMPFVPVLVSLAVAGFIDKNNPRLLPRSYAVLTIVVLLLLLPSQLIFFFKSGPFAWDGVLAFWLQAVAMSTWILVTAGLVKKAALPVQNYQVS